jgi:hypothetical protein
VPSAHRDPSSSVKLHRRNVGTPRRAFPPPVDAASEANESRDMSHPTASPDSEARHSEDWYRDGPADAPPRGQRIFVRCEGGPCLSRLETFPPRLEIAERGGLYVLVDDGPVSSWLYQFVAVLDD